MGSIVWEQVSEWDVIRIFFSDSAIIICHIFVTIVKYMVTGTLTLSRRIASLVRFFLRLLLDIVVLDEARRLISLICFFDVALYPHNFFFDA